MLFLKCESISQKMIDSKSPQQISKAYKKFLSKREYPCIAAKAALKHEQIHSFFASHMACPNDDHAILKFLYDFVDAFRDSDQLYHSAIIIFQAPHVTDEETFENLLWQRLQSLHQLDSKMHQYDTRVSSAPTHAKFSFSIKEEAMFVIGLHPGSSRPARQFEYPALVFNPHGQFEQLRKLGKYEKMKYAVRKKEISNAGSVNPMLTDFGELSEVFQYSGKAYNVDWECPLNITHE